MTNVYDQQEFIKKETLPYISQVVFDPIHDDETYTISTLLLRVGELASQEELGLQYYDKALEVIEGKISSP